MVRRFLLILFCYLPTVLVYGQLDTTRVLEGDWTLNSFSCKKSYDYKDTNNGFTNVDDYKLWLTIGNKKAELTSTTVFSFLNDSTVSVERFTYRRSKSHLVFKRKKTYKQFLIEKITHRELVLTETVYNSLHKEPVRYRYYFTKNDLVEVPYNFLGNWIKQDTSRVDLFSYDTLVLFPKHTLHNWHGSVNTLTIQETTVPTVAHNSYTRTSSYSSPSDSLYPYGRTYVSGSLGPFSWIYNPEGNLIHFFTDYLETEYVTYRIETCLPGEKLVLIKQD